MAWARQEVLRGLQVPTVQIRRIAIEPRYLVVRQRVAYWPFWTSGNCSGHNKCVTSVTGADVGDPEGSARSAKLDSGATYMKSRYLTIAALAFAVAAPVSAQT